MRLIDTENLELNEFSGDEVPAYAILSHTWGTQEVTLREWTEPSVATTSKTGYRKICMACSLARRYGHKWLWVDTNCIDKTSSVEMSEAINSMFSWYHGAETCFAYLADVVKDSLVDVVSINDEEAGSGSGAQSDAVAGYGNNGNPSAAQTGNGSDTDGGTPSQRHFGRGRDPESLSQFRKSRWFTRGWTLQELLAPESLVFYSREWSRLGTKVELADEIANITRIDKSYLSTMPGPSHFPPFLQASVATRMSWIATRRTTRVEDMAYCMLGLFDINMPLLYGEGLKAFVRLQEEIIRVYNDHSIFAWANDVLRPGTSDNESIGFLAPSPQAFAGIAPATPPLVSVLPSPYSITNVGLSIKLPLLRTLCGFIATINACIPGDTHTSLGICLRGNSMSDTLSRSSFPPRPLRICFPNPSSDLFLMAVERGQFFSGCQQHPPPWSAPTPLSPVGRYGLMLTFNYPSKELPLLYAHPKQSLDHNNSVIVFPNANMDSDAWLAMSSNPGTKPVVCVRTAGVVLAEDRFSKADYRGSPHVGLLILLTLSIVTWEGCEHTSTVYSHGRVSLPRQTSWDRFTAKYDVKTWAGSLLKKEIKRVFDGACKIDVSRTGIPSRFLYQSSSKAGVQIGCCNMGHPHFEELRLAII